MFVLHEVKKPDIISWRLEGDVSLQYQVYRDLLDVERLDLKAKIASEGWGLQFLSCRKPGGHWGLRFYQPKWVCTHYTLLDLKNLRISPEVEVIQETLRTIMPARNAPMMESYRLINTGDVVNGMLLHYASYFRVPGAFLQPVVDFLLAERMPDGGFNCASNTVGAMHNYLHTILSVLEGIHEYQANGYSYQLYELLDAQNTSQEFIL